MASFRIIPLHEDDGTDTETLEERVKAESPLDLPDPREQDAPLRSGPLPQTLEFFDGGIAALEYGFEVERTTKGLDGEERAYILTDRAPVIFLGNGYAAIDAYCSSDVEREILDLLNNLLGSEVSYETVSFGEETLRKVIKQAETVEETDFSPERDDLPKRVLGEHQSGLRNTRMWPEYEEAAGFKEGGVTTIYGRDLELSLCSRVLRHITDEVVSNLDVDSFQKRLGGVDR